jgi:hypothetical protein
MTKNLLTPARKHLMTTWEGAQHEPPSGFVSEEKSLTLVWSQATVLRTQPPRNFCQDDDVC